MSNITYTVVCERPDGNATLIGPFWDKAEATREVKHRKQSDLYTLVELRRGEHLEPVRD